MSVPYNITDRYQAQIVSILKGDITSPLLSRVNIQTGNLSNILSVDSDSDKHALFQGVGHGNIKDTGIHNVPQGLSYDVEFKGTSTLTDSMLQTGVQEVVRRLYSTLETHLIWGRTSNLPDSPIQGAIAVSDGSNFEETDNSIMLVKDNDFAPTSIKKYESKAIRAYDFDKVKKGVVIAPEKATLVGNITPQIGIYKDVRSNRVKVVGVLQVSGGFASGDSVKYI